MGALISALCLMLLALCVQDIVVAGKRLVDMRRLATLSTISEPLIKSLGATRLKRADAMLSDATGALLFSSAQVSSMQSTTAAAVSAISRIDHTISRMNEISASIAAAMEEQGAATQAIARNLQEAAAGASDMSNNVGGVNAVVERTGDASQRMFGAADQLSRQTEALKGEVSAFLSAIRAA